jgi:hypothetical protein
VWRIEEESGWKRQIDGDFVGVGVQKMAVMVGSFLLMSWWRLAK